MWKMVLPRAPVLAFVHHLFHPPRKLKEIHLSNLTNLRYQNRTVYANYSNETLVGKVMSDSLCSWSYHKQQQMLMTLMRIHVRTKSGSRDSWILYLNTPTQVKVTGSLMHRLISS